MNWGDTQTFSPLHPPMDQKQHCGNKKYTPKTRTNIASGMAPSCVCHQNHSGWLWAALSLQLPPLAELLFFLSTGAVIPAQKSSGVAQGLWNEVQVLLHLAFKVILVLCPSIHQSILTLEVVAGGCSLGPGLPLHFS